METIKFFNLQKANKKSDNQPDYRISFKLKDTFVEGGACWIKTDKAGKTFLSCKLGDAWKDHSDEKKSRKGWHLEEDKIGEAPEDIEEIINDDEVGF